MAAEWSRESLLVALGRPDRAGEAVNAALTLTSTYRVTTVGGLSQSYTSRADALASISRSSRWKIAEAGQIEEGAHHYVEFQYRLDTAELPRPMQIGISGEPDWQLLVKRTLRLN